MAERKAIQLVVNGEQHTGHVSPRMLLSDFIRDELQLTGTHVGCEQGACGACTVLLDGRPTRSCLVFAVQTDGASVETIEALGSDTDDLHPVQQAFWEHHGLQCGFCTPGMVMTAKSFLDENGDPSDDEIREAIAGNLCRCTGYVFIFDSIRAAAKMMASEDPDRA